MIGRAVLPPFQKTKKHGYYQGIFLAVKGSLKTNRLFLAEKTWLAHTYAETIVLVVEKVSSLAKQRRLLNLHGDKILYSPCGGSHNIWDLRCKTYTALRTFLSQSNGFWFCYVDDGMFVSLKNLIKTLQPYRVAAANEAVIGDLCTRDWGKTVWNNTILHTCGGMCATRSVVNIIRPYLDSLKSFHAACGDLPDDMCVPMLLYRHGIKMEHNNNFASEISFTKPAPLSELRKFAVVSYKHIAMVPHACTNLSKRANLMLNMVKLSYDRADE